MPGLEEESCKNLTHKLSRITETGERTTGYAIISRIDGATGESRRFWVFYWGVGEDDFSFLALATPGSQPPPLATWM